MSVYEKKLKNGLIMRSIRNENDIRRYSAFHEKLFHNKEHISCNLMLCRHPQISHDHFLYVEDPQTGNIVSTMCLVPWQCFYEEVTLDVAQVELVSTDPEYRRKGLIRTQLQRLHEMENERQYHLSMLGGIRYYYRRFGYTYAVDAPEVGDLLHSGMIPIPPNVDTLPYRLRQAVPDDASLLHRFYQKAMSSVHFHIQRYEQLWYYMLKWLQFPVRILEDSRDNRSVGYVSTSRNEKDGTIHIEESAIFDTEDAMAVLHLLNPEANCAIYISGPENCLMRRMGRALGSGRCSNYQWSLHINNIPHLLRSIAPVLERRLAASAYAGFTKSFCINLFDKAFSIVFDRGKLQNVDSLGFIDTSFPYSAEQGEIQIPPDAFVRLVLGYSNLRELSDAWPDIRIIPAWRLVVEVLFPKMESYLSLPYSYRGPSPDGSLS